MAIAIPAPRTGREILEAYPSHQSAIELNGLGCVFETASGSYEAIRNIDLRVAPGEFLVIVGPSGCGKTTLLRVISGLQEPTSGSMTLRGPEGGSPSNAMVFQGRSVFPWMTVAGNVDYGLKLAGIPKRTRQTMTREMLAIVGLTRFSDAYPHQISEGMRQRVALARALVVDPDLLLLDEPFGALDEQTRFLLQDELLRIWERTRKTMVFVTHSIDEALTLADRVVVMTAHPGTIKAEIDVPFARPRELAEVRSDPAFARLFHQIWDLLRDEVQAARAAAGEVIR